jgi:branched-chain amino acid transport system permease protein
MILGIFAMSYDLLFGYTGMLSLGHALFQGASAYTIAILMVQLGFNIQDAFLPIMVALVVGIIMGFVQGFLACRLGHTGIFLVTFATAETLFLLIMADPLGITNSENGIPDIPRETVFGLLNIKPEVNFYYFVLGLLIFSYLALRAITRLPFGDTLKAIRENPQRSKYLGYDVRQYRTVAFMVSGFFASLAGCLTALHETSVGPEMLSVVESSNPFLFTALGGPGTLIGPLLGTAVMVVLTEIISDYTHYHTAINALIIVLLIMFLPGGFYSIPQMIRSKKYPDEMSLIPDTGQMKSEDHINNGKNT